MVKQQKKNTRKKRLSKGFTANSAKARKINASTANSLSISIRLSKPFLAISPAKRGASDIIQKNCGKKSYRPVLCFIEETRGYLIGKLRKGETISGKEAATCIAKIKNHLPGCVQSC